MYILYLCQPSTGTVFGPMYQAEAQGQIYFLHPSLACGSSGYTCMLACIAFIPFWRHAPHPETQVALDGVHKISSFPYRGPSGSAAVRRYEPEVHAPPLQHSQVMVEALLWR